MNGIILASGFSTRMGNNKLLMKINEEEIIRRVIRIVKSSEVDNVILVAREEAVIEIGKEEKILVVKNNKAHLGQSTSIHLGLEKSNLNKNFMFFCGDQPFIDINSINKLVKLSNENYDKIIVPKVREKTGSPVIFPKSFYNDLMLLTGDIGGRKIIKRNKERIIYESLDNNLFLEDIDTTEDYIKLLKL